MANVSYNLTNNKFLSLDGTNDLLEIPHNDSLSLSGAFTIETWVNPAQIKNDWQPLITKENNNGGERNYGLFIRPNTLKLHASVFKTNGGYNVLEESGTSLNQNEWNHVAMTYDGSTLKLYVNGKFDSSINVSGNALQNTHPVKIGNENNVFTGFKGKINDVRIWNTARSEAEIQNKLNATLNGNETGLMGYWNFNNDDINGTTAADIASGNNGTLKNGAKLDLNPQEATFTPIIKEGNNKQFLSLDGANDLATIPHDNSLDVSDSLTVEAWVYAEQNSSNTWPAAVSKKGGWGTTPGWLLRLRDDVTPDFFLADGTNRVDVLSSENVATGQWHHLAGVIDRQAGEAKLYVNGALAATQALNGLGSVNSNVDLLLGGLINNNALVDMWKGKLDNVRVWNTVRTEAEIKNNLNATLKGTETGLIGYWNFDGDKLDGTVAKDATANGNDGTLNNGAKLEIDESFIGYADIVLDQPVNVAPGAIINYQIEGASTATPQTDFYNAQLDISTTDGSPPTNSVFIPQGENTARIHFTALSDAVAEGDENIKITLLSGTDNFGGTYNAANNREVLSLNGTSDYVEIPHNESLSLPDAFTIETWVNPAEIKNHWQPLITKENNNGWDRNYSLFIRPNTLKLHGSVFNTNGVNNTVNSGISLNQNEWNHVAMTYDGSTFKLYVNGKLDGTTNVSGSLFTNTHPVKIGKENNAFTPFAGEIDDVRIWKNARTQEEIRQNMYVSPVGNEAGLAGYWSFDAGSVSGNTVTDLSPNNNDGTLLNNKVLSLGTESKAINLQPLVDNGTIADRDGSYPLLSSTQITEQVSNYLEVGGNATTDLAFEGAANYTMSAWVKPEGGGTIISKQNGGVIGAYILAVRNNGKIQAYREAPPWGSTSNTAIPFGEWSHVATTYDGTTLKIYINGQLAGSQAYGPINTNTQTPVLIGARQTQGNPSALFQGSIDEVQIWNKALSASEIARAMGRSVSGNEAGLVGYWDFDASNGSGTNVADLTGNGYDGQVKLTDIVYQAKYGIIGVDSYFTNIPVLGDDLVNAPNVIDISDSVLQNSIIYKSPDPSVTIFVEDSPAYQAGIAFSDRFGDEITANNPIVADSQGKATFKVKLTSQPTANVTINLTPESGTLNNNNLTFNANNWDTYQTVNLTGLGEIFNGFDVSASVTSNDSTYSSLSGSTLGVIDSTPRDNTKILVTEGATVQDIPPITANINATKDALEGRREPGQFTVNLSDAAPKGGFVVPYEISGGSATETTDYTVSANPGLGKSLNLDGTNGLLEIPHNNSLSLSNAFTIETWVNPAQIKNDWQPLITKENNNGGERNYSLFIRPNTLKLHGSVFNTDGGNDVVDSGISLNQNGWNHVAMTYDGSTLKLYVNGKLDATTNVSGNALQNTHPVKIGKEINIFTPFAGAIDDVRVWNNARTQAEIQNNLNATLNGNETGLVGYWNFNNDSGTTATDLTNNNNNGTLNNGASIVESNTSLLKIDEGKTSANISIEAIDNKLAEGDKTVTVTLGGTNNQATLNIIDDETAGAIELAQLGKTGSIEVPAIKLEVTTAYNPSTGTIGLKIAEGADSYTFEADTIITFTNGVEITIPAGTTIGSAGTTVTVAPNLGNIPTAQTSVTESRLLDVEILTYDEDLGTGKVTANVRLRLTKKPAAGETVSVTLTDANGTDSASFNFNENNWNQYKQTNANNFLELTPGANNAVALTANIAGNATNNIVLPLSANVLAAPLGNNNTANGSKLITTEGERVQFTATTAYDANAGTVELELFNSSKNYTVTAGQVITFDNGTQAEVTVDTALTVGQAQAVPVTLTQGTDIPVDEGGSVVLAPGETTVAVRLSSEPTGGDVVLDLVLSDGTEGEFINNGGQTQSLTFTQQNWDQYQEVTVKGKEDAIVDGNKAYYLDVSGASNNADTNYRGQLQSLEITNQDNDLAPNTATQTTNNLNQPPHVASLSVNKTQVAEGGAVAATFNLNQPAPAGGLNVEYEVVGQTASTFEDLQLPFVLGDNNPLVLAKRASWSEVSGNWTLSGGDILNLTGDLPPGIVPTLADIDGDGDLDAFAGESVIFIANQRKGITYYENTGTANAPVFVQRTGTQNPLNLVGPSNLDLIAAAPTFIDIGNDGDLDVFVGDKSGDIFYFENTGNSQNPNFVQKTGTANPLNAVNSLAGKMLNPTFVDIDGDGDLDFFRGSGAIGASFTSSNIRGITWSGWGNILYFENQGNDTFTQRTGADNPLNNLSLTSFNSVTFGDMDLDGDQDAFLGEANNSELTYLRNIGTASQPFFERAPEYNPFAGIKFGRYPRLALADIDNDNQVEAFVGNDNGSVAFFERFENLATAYIPEGQSTATVNIATTDDNIAENKENFNVRLVDKDDESDVDEKLTLEVTANYKADTSEGKVVGYSVGLQIQQSSTLPPNLVTTDDRLKIANAFDPTTGQVTLEINDTSNSIALPAGDVLTFKNGTVIEVGTATTVQAGSPLAVDVLLKEVPAYSIPQGTKLTFNDGSIVTVAEAASISAFESTPVQVQEQTTASLRPTAGDTTQFSRSNRLSVSTNSFEANITILDNDTAGVRVTTDAAGNNVVSGTFNTTEAGAEKTFYARLETEPTEPVTVYVGSTNKEEGLLGGQEVVELQFDRTNWKVAQGFTVTGVDDFVDDGNIAYNLKTTVKSRGDLHYREGAIDIDVLQGLTNGSVQLELNELNIQEAKLPQGTRLNFSNGTVATVDSDVTLDNDATNTPVDVAVTIDTTILGFGATSNSGSWQVTEKYNSTLNQIELRNTSGNPITLTAGQTINFTNGAQLTVDADISINENSRDLVKATLTTPPSAIDTGLTTSFIKDISPDVNLSNTDNDTASLVLVNVEEIAAKEGVANNFYKVELKTQPTDIVTIVMTPSDDQIALEGKMAGEPLTITFDETNWNSPQTIGVTAIDDFEVEFDHTTNIAFDASGSADSVYAGLDVSNSKVKVNIIDNDLPTASVLSAAGAIEANAPGYFAINLDKALPNDYDDTGLKINYTVSGTTDTNGTGATDDLQPITQGTARIAPGESRTPLIAFPIDDFKAEGVPLNVTTAYSGGSIGLQIKNNTTLPSNFNLQAGTKLTFSNGAIATVDANATLSKNSATTVNLTIAPESSLTNIPVSETTRIPAETVIVEIAPGNGYLVSSDENIATLEVEDNDIPGVRVVEASERTTVTEGEGPAEYFISLLSEPANPVTISIAPVQTTRNLKVTADLSGGTVGLRVDDPDVDSLMLPAGTVLNFGGGKTATVAADTFVSSGANGNSVNVNNTSGTITTGNATTYSYQELSSTNSLTFNSNNWYKLQPVTVTGLDDNVAEIGNTHEATLKYTVTSNDTDYNGLKVPAQTISIKDRPFDPNTTASSLTQGLLAFQDSLDTLSLPLIGNLDGVAPPFINNVLTDVVAEVRAMDFVTGDKLAQAFTTAFNNNINTGGTVTVEITDLSSNNISFFINAGDSFNTPISLASDLGLPALGIGMETNGNLDATFDYNFDFAFGLNDTDGFYIDTANTNLNVNAGVNLSPDFAATGGLGFLQMDLTNGIDAAAGDTQGTGVNATFDIGLQDPNNQLTVTELNNLRKQGQLSTILDYGFAGDAALDFDVVTSIEGSTALPSFGFNLFSDLPLFNYTNADSTPPQPTTVSIAGSSNVTVQENTAKSINVSIADNGNGTPGENIRLPKGTQLVFNWGTNNKETVIVDKTVSIVEGSNGSISVKLKDNKNGTNNTATINSAAEAQLEASAFNVAFNNISLDFGSFVTGVVSPVVDFLADVIEPIAPVVNALNEPIGFLDEVGLTSEFDINGDGQANIVEVASSIIEKLPSRGSQAKIDYTKFFDAIVGVTDLVAAVQDLQGSLGAGENFAIDFGSYTLQNFQGASSTTSAADVNPQTQGSGQLSSNPKNQTKNKGQGKQTLSQKVDKMFGALDKLGIGIPILEDPFTAINLFLGNDIDLITYDMPALDIQYELDKTFNIIPVPQVNGLIQGGFSVFSDLFFGLDTVGFSAWEKTGFDPAQSYLVFDGLYLSDIDPNTGEDVDELSVDATMAIGAELNVVVASASVLGGIDGQVGLDVVDIGEYTGQSDGKIRGSEVFSRISNPLSLFELAGSIEAFFRAIVKVGVDLGFFEITKTVYDKELARVPLFDFTLGGAPGGGGSTGGGTGSSGGTVASGYIEGATVFLDTNFNLAPDPLEPTTTTDKLGNYNLEYELGLFDANENGKIDDNEGQIVAVGGVDTTTGLPLAIPMVANVATGTLITPITTIKTGLEKAGLDVDAANNILGKTLGLASDLDDFDPYEAEGEEYAEGVNAALSHILLHSLIINGSAFLKGAGFSGNSADILTDAIVEKLSTEDEVELEEKADIEDIFNSALQETGINNIDSQTVGNVATLVGSFNDFIEDLLEIEEEDDDDEKEKKPKSVRGVVPTIAPFKHLLLGELPELTERLTRGELTLDEVYASLDAELNETGYQLRVVEEVEEEDGVIEIETEFIIEKITQGAKGIAPKIEGGTVFLDTNFNEKLNGKEVSGVIEKSGKFVLDFENATYDKNGNNKIDPDEGQIVVVGGVDALTGVALNIPLIANAASAEVVSGLTTVKVGLERLGITSLEAGKTLNRILELEEEDLESFNPYREKGDDFEEGVDGVAADTLMKSLLVNSDALLKNAGFKGNSFDVVLQGIAQKFNSAGNNFRLKNTNQIQQVLDEILTVAEVTVAPEVVEGVAELVSSFNGLIGDILEEKKDGQQSVVNRSLGQIVPLQEMLLGELPKITRRLTRGNITVDEAFSSVESQLSEVGFDFTVKKNGKATLDFTDQEVKGSAEDDTLGGSGGDDTLVGGGGNDLVISDGGQDTLEGRVGFDHLLGGSEDDVLSGGIGRDRLNGGPGNDTITGGASIDRFIFATNREFDAEVMGSDRIMDFNPGQDIILLDKKTFTELESISGDGFSVETEFAAVTKGAATSEAFIVYHSDKGKLFYNENGSEPGLGDGGEFATLAGKPVISADDFFVR